MTQATEPSRKTWRDWHDANPQLFPLVEELADDPGPIGYFLRCIPAEVRRDADRCPNPWKHLSLIRLMSTGHRELFRACASVLPAAVHFARAQYSRGSLLEPTMQAKTDTDREAIIRKLFPALYRADRALREAAAHEGPEVLRGFEEREARLLNIYAKKKGKAVAIIRPAKPIADPIRRLMVTGWLRCGSGGDPGLMFYSDEALVSLLGLFGRASINRDWVEKTRERWGLRKASEKFPYITGARMNPNTGLIELNTLEAKTARYEWPKRLVRLRCRIELNGRVVYAGIPF